MSVEFFETDHQSAPEPMAKTSTLASRKPTTSGVRPFRVFRSLSPQWMAIFDLAETFTAEDFAEALLTVEQPFKDSDAVQIIHQLIYEERYDDLQCIADRGAFRGAFTKLAVGRFQNLPTLEKIQQLSKSPELEGAFRTVDFLEFAICRESDAHLQFIQSHERPIFDVQTGRELSFSEAVAEIVQRNDYAITKCGFTRQNDCYERLRPALREARELLQPKLESLFAIAARQANIELVRRLVEDFDAPISQLSTATPEGFLSPSNAMEYRNLLCDADQPNWIPDRRDSGFLKQVSQLSLYLRVMQRAELHGLDRVAASQIANSSPTIAEAYANQVVQTAEEALQLVGQLEAENRRLRAMRL